MTLIKSAHNLMNLAWKHAHKADTNRFEWLLEVTILTRNQCVCIKGQRVSGLLSPDRPLHLLSSAAQMFPDSESWRKQKNCQKDLWEGVTKLYKQVRNITDIQGLGKAISYGC